MSDNGGRGGSFWGFLAFLVTMFAAVLYLVSFILSFWEIDIKIIDTMSSIASVIMICIVSVFGWRFIKRRSITWRLLYIFLLLAVVASVVVPVILQFIPKQ